MTRDLSKKGRFRGLCNRQACLKPHATYYNASTRSYYCLECAYEINKAAHSFREPTLCFDFSSYATSEIEERQDFYNQQVLSQLLGTTLRS